MHRLGRYVRFCVNPFLAGESDGYNSYSAKPCGEGLALYMELGVELAGKLEAETGFVVNVSDIDRVVRAEAVPIFSEHIKSEYAERRHVDLAGLAELMRVVCGKLSGRFGDGTISKLSLKLNPNREIALDSDKAKEVYFSEKFEFAATHKLWNDSFSEAENFERFGKCANPNGHGHNYIVEVTVKGQAGGLGVADIEKVVAGELIEMVDHKNLNADVEEFLDINPTVENIAVFAWEKLKGKFGGAELHCVTVWETDKTYCSYYG